MRRDPVSSLNLFCIIYFAVLCPSVVTMLYSICHYYKKYTKLYYFSSIIQQIFDNFDKYSYTVIKKFERGYLWIWEY